MGSSLLMSSHLFQVRKAIESAGLEALFLRDSPEVYQQLWNSLSYHPVYYSESHIDYQYAYLNNAGCSIEDITLVFLNDNQPCALWPLSISSDSDKVTIHSSGTPIMAPAFRAGVSDRTIKRLCSRSITFLQTLGARLNTKELILEQSSQPQNSTAGLTEWHQQLLAAGATAVLRHDLFADLRVDLTAIRAGFRKSYRPLINVGLRTWQGSVLDHNSDHESLNHVWSEFRQLHLQAAGRITRNEDSWNKQLTMIQRGVAFLCCLRDPADNRLVGAGFFQCTRDEGLYSVAAYDRSLFNKPLGHVVQQLAIETMKARGLTWYRIV